MLTDNLILWLGLAALVGLIVGSFLNVVIHRLPIMLRQLASRTGSAEKQSDFSLAVPASHCPHCKTPLNLSHNIPLISYLMLKGRCGFCDSVISPRYPLVEVIAMLSTIIVAIKLGPNVYTLLGIVLTWILIALSFIDIENKILPDEITLPLIWMGLLLSLFEIFTVPSMAIIGAIAGYGVFWLINRVYALISNREGMGYGDMKLLAACGAWFGWTALPFIILTASLIGLAISLFLLLGGRLQRGETIPFGPYLCFACWLYLLLNKDAIYQAFYPFLAYS